jgi:hypothetical protein
MVEEMSAHKECSALFRCSSQHTVDHSTKNSLMRWAQPWLLKEAPKVPQRVPGLPHSTKAQSSQKAQFRFDQTTALAQRDHPAFVIRQGLQNEPSNHHDVGSSARGTLHQTSKWRTHTKTQPPKASEYSRSKNRRLRSITPSRMISGTIC